MAVTVALLVGAVVTVAVTPVAAVLARRFDVVDRPGPLKVQSRPVPYLGGLAVLAGLVGPILAARPAVAIPLTLAALLGLVDDVSDLSIRVRFPTELAIAVLIPVTVSVRGPLFPVAIVIGVALVNAVNLLDGLDGLATSVALISAIGFVVVQHGDARVIAAALAGALAGFLVWNRPPARIYLGDSGSYLVGAALATLAAYSMAHSGTVHLTAAAALLVAVPAGDTAVAILRRRRARRPLLMGDRGHVYDQLVDRGWTRLRASAACVIAQAMLVGIAVAVAHMSDAAAVVVVIVLAAAVGVWAVRTFTGPAAWSAAE